MISKIVHIKECKRWYRLHHHQKLCIVHLLTEAVLDFFLKGAVNRITESEQGNEKRATHLVWGDPLLSLVPAQCQLLQLCELQL